jgi:phosphopantothenoylcysteine decarboxylase/phosphopantothenate--cysteine ligase
VFLVGFKAEVNVSKKALIDSAKKKMKESDADIIIANDIGIKYQKNPDLNEIILLDKSGKIVTFGRRKKEEISKFIRKQIELKLQ